MSKHVYENKFKTSLLQFLDELIDQYPTYPNFVLVRIYIKDRMTSEKIILKFIYEVLPYIDIIKNRNISLFTQTDVIFKSCFGAKKEKDIKYLKELWEKENNDTKNAIWKWLDFFSTISLKYYKKFLSDDNFDLEEKKTYINSKYN